MKAYNTDQKIKNDIVAVAKHHAKLDAFIQGDWLTDIQANGIYKGCFYGCMTQEDSEYCLEKFSQENNLDPWYIHLTEKIFEGLTEDQAKTFPVRALEIVPVGFDFNQIKSPFFKALLTDQLRFVEAGSEQGKAINQCIDLFDMPFNEISESAARSAAESAARSAWSAAWSAAESAAESAARSAARSAAESAWSARSAAESAARSAARSAAESAWSARSAAESAYYVWMRDVLFELIRKGES